MLRFSGATLVLGFQALLFAASPVRAATPNPGVPAQQRTAEWSAKRVEHVYGLPDAKPKDKGTLTLTATGLSFADIAGTTTISRQSVSAVSAGNQRVEIWGMKGRILRAVIPDGGGAVAAAMMYHRVDMLTVEFADARGGQHGAVFFLPANEASRALESFSMMPMTAQAPLQSATCQDGFVRPRSLVLAAPVWDQADVPAAYRALVYERLLDGLRQVKGADHVYRDGENTGKQGCPQYTMQLSISAFKEGSQVKRAVLGPAGFFVSTTQMLFDSTITDALGQQTTKEADQSDRTRRD